MKYNFLRRAGIFVFSLSMIVASSTANASSLEQDVNDNILGSLIYNDENTNLKDIIFEHLKESSYQERGAKPPTGTSFVDLSNTNYDYDIDEMKVQIYTNSLFSGVTAIDVSVGSISIDKNGMANQSKGITVSLYNADKKFISSKSVGVGGLETVSFIGLKASTKYYVGFSKTNDTQIYSFSGTINEQ